MRHARHSGKSFGNIMGNAMRVESHGFSPSVEPYSPVNRAERESLIKYVRKY